MKKKLSKSNYKFLETELKEHKDRGIITSYQLEDIMTFYEEESQLNFIKILVMIGSILIGLGILSFVASNWPYMGKVLKISVIVAALGFSTLISFKLEKYYPRTSKSLMYLSSLIYGAGIFLIEQIFNMGGNHTSAFLLWSIGVVVMGVLLKEMPLLIFSHVLLIIYIGQSFNENIIIYPIILIVVFYMANKYFNHLKIITFFNNFVALQYFLYLLNYNDVKGLYVAIIFFIIGLVMYYFKHNLNHDIFKLEGIIVFGISGLFLTGKHIWEDLNFVTNGNFVAICFGILLLLYLLSLVKKGLLTPLLFICALILRYYFDTLYDFMPKSLFFIIGGVILLGFGYYFERLRKQQGGVIGEKNI